MHTLLNEDDWPDWDRRYFEKLAEDRRLLRVRRDVYEKFCSDNPYLDMLKSVETYLHGAERAHDYSSLRRVLELAYKQASEGKGKERHADGRAFEDQPIMVIQTLLGEKGLGYTLGQIMKKAQEASRMPHDKATTELLDIIVYAAAAYLHLEKTNATDKHSNDSRPAELPRE